MKENTTTFDMVEFLPPTPIFKFLNTCTIISKSYLHEKQRMSITIILKLVIYDITKMS